jgi:hypothetical protein
MLVRHCESGTLRSTSCRLLSWFERRKKSSQANVFQMLSNHLRNIYILYISWRRNCTGKSNRRLTFFPPRFVIGVKSSTQRSPASSATTGRWHQSLPSQRGSLNDLSRKLPGRYLTMAFLHLLGGTWARGFQPVFGSSSKETKVCTARRRRPARLGSHHQWIRYGFQRS